MYQILQTSRRIIFNLKTSDSKDSFLAKLDSWLDRYEDLERYLKQEEYYWNSQQLETFIKIKELGEQQDIIWKQDRKREYCEHEIEKLKGVLLVQEMNNQFDEASKTRNKISQLSFYLNPIQRNQITPIDILQAKQFPINQLLRSVRKEGDREWCLCPFHKEKTPSMCIYVKSNKFHCFGCGEHGDSISAVMKLEGLSYYDAIRRLIN